MSTQNSIGHLKFEMVSGNLLQKRNGRLEIDLKQVLVDTQTKFTIRVSCNGKDAAAQIQSVKIIGFGISSTEPIPPHLDLSPRIEGNTHFDLEFEFNAMELGLIPSNTRIQLNVFSEGIDEVVLLYIKAEVLETEEYCDKAQLQLYMGMTEFKVATRANSPRAKVEIKNTNSFKLRLASLQTTGVDFLLLEVGAPIGSALKAIKSPDLEPGESFVAEVVFVGVKSDCEAELKAVVGSKLKSTIRLIGKNEGVKS